MAQLWRDTMDAVISLQNATAYQFERVHETLDEHSATLNRHERRLDSIDGRLDRVELRLDGIDVRLDGIDGRLESMDARFGRELQSIHRKLDRLLGTQ